MLHNEPAAHQRTISDIIAESCTVASQANAQLDPTTYRIARESNADILPLFERLRAEGFSCTFAQDEEVMFTSKDKRAVLHIAPDPDDEAAWTVNVQESG